VHGEVVKVLADPALKQKSEQTGNYPVTSTPEEFAAFMRKETARWSRVIKELNLKLD
jgi:tripartite-type tricarboxylate transporter receptor subunit TctC